MFADDRALFAGLLDTACCDRFGEEELLGVEEVLPENCDVGVGEPLLLPIISLKEVIDDVGDVTAGFR